MSAPRSTAREVGAWFADMPLTSRHWIAGLAVFVAFVIESWEMMIIIFSSGAIAEDLGLTTAQVGSLISALFLGMIPGALLWGKIGGALGRKGSLMLSIGLYGLFPVLAALSPTYEMLWAARFAAGLVLAGALVVTFPYFEELVPVPVRGRATVYLSAGWPVGVLVAIGVTSALGPLGWRWVMGLSTVVSLWALVIWRVVPESPYWLAAKGRTDEAATAIDRLQPGVTGTSVLAPGGDKPQAITFASIFEGPIIRITAIQSMINFCFAWGYWGLASWMPALLSERGLSTPQGLGFMALSAVFMFPGYVTASHLTGRFGRKKVMLVFVAGAAAAGFAFANAQSLTQLYLWNFLLSFFSLGGWGVWNTWLAELYDTRRRGAGTAWGVTTQRVANALAPVVIGAVLANTGFLQTVSFITVFLAATFAAAALLPETEGVVLD